MSTDTAIEWTDVTWNPTTGCDRVSPGCDNCYALTLAKRLKGMGSAKYQTDGDPRTSGPGFGLTTHGDMLDAPLRWKKPRRVFVNSMSDLFHDQIPDEFIIDVFARMWWAPQHTFQVLTKRHGRMRSLVPRIEAHLRERERDLALVDCPTPLAWPLPNVWLGVSVEDQKRADLRIPALLETPAAVGFLSCEPLLGPVDLNPWLVDPTFNPAYRVARCGQESGHWRHVVEHGPDQPRNCPGTAGDLSNPRRVDWVITGGESGPGFRLAMPDWFRAIRDQCAASGTAYLHKQNGGRTPKSGGRKLDGRTWDEYPEVAS